MPKGLKYDEIGYWSEVKLDIIKEYAAAYYLFYASHKTIAEDIVQYIFKKYENRRGS